MSFWLQLSRIRLTSWRLFVAVRVWPVLQTRGFFSARYYFVVKDEVIQNNLVGIVATAVLFVSAFAGMSLAGNIAVNTGQPGSSIFER